jgi:hypothetical protein
MEEVRKNKEWMCPHCVEETGLLPYWICNRYGSHYLKIAISLNHNLVVSCDFFKQYYHISKFICCVLF